MATITLAPALARWLTASPGADVASVSFPTNAATVHAALQDLFAQHPHLKSYVLDERGTIRHHVVVFVDNVAVTDKAHQRERLNPHSEVFLFQALSGG